MAKKNNSTTTRTTSIRKGAPQAPPIKVQRQPRANGAIARDRADPNLEPVVLSHAQIAQRAYQLWQQTGNPNQAQNWADAERQLRTEFRGA